MAVIAPTGNQYTFTPTLFTITNASGEYTIRLNGVDVRVAALNGTVTFNASGLMRSFFTIDTLRELTTVLPVNWQVLQNGSSQGSGSFTAAWGTNEAITFPNAPTVRVTWIDREGHPLNYDFCLYNRSYGTTERETVNRDGINYTISIDEDYTFTLYSALVDRATFESLVSIQQSPVIYVTTNLGQTIVEAVPTTQITNGKPLQTFVLTLRLPNAR